MVNRGVTRLDGARGKKQVCFSPKMRKSYGFLSPKMRKIYARTPWREALKRGPGSPPHNTTDQSYFENTITKRSISLLQTVVFVRYVRSKNIFRCFMFVWFLIAQVLAVQVKDNFSATLGLAQRHVWFGSTSRVDCCFNKRNTRKSNWWCVHTHVTRMRRPT